MKGIFRNKEVFASSVVYVIISLAAVVAAFMWSVSFGIFTAVLCIVFLTLSFIITCRRYRRISRLSGRIDKILHGKDYLTEERHDEGELAILESEVSPIFREGSFIIRFKRKLSDVFEITQRYEIISLISLRS